VDALASHLHVYSLLFQPGTLADGAAGLSPISCQHHPVLDLVEVLLQHLEKIVDPVDTEVVPPVPQNIFLFIAQFEVWTMDGKIGFIGVEYKLSLPLAHLFSLPALNALFLNRKAFVGNNQVLVDT